MEAMHKMSQKCSVIDCCTIGITHIANDTTYTDFEEFRA